MSGISNPNPKAGFDANSRMGTTPQANKGLGSMFSKGMAMASGAVQVAGAALPGGRAVLSLASNLANQMGMANSSGSQGPGQTIPSGGRSNSATLLGSDNTPSAGPGTSNNSTNPGTGNAPPGVSAESQYARETAQMNRTANAQMLGLQQEIQQDTRKFQTISNIMKAKHDTQKNAIGNMR